MYQNIVFSFLNCNKYCQKRASLDAVANINNKVNQPGTSAAGGGGGGDGQQQNLAEP